MTAIATCSLPLKCSPLVATPLIKLSDSTDTPLNPCRHRSGGSFYVEVIHMHENMTVTEFAECWIAEVAPHRLKPTALEEYRSLLRLHVLPALGNIRLSALCAHDVQRLLTGQIEAGYAPRSIRNHLVALRSVLRSAVDLGLIESNVSMKVAPPREYREERRFLAPAQLNAVLEATPDAWKSLIALPIYTVGRVYFIKV